MISKYPEFTEVDLSVQKELEAELSKYDSHSDFNFLTVVRIISIYFLESLLFDI